MSSRDFTWVDQFLLTFDQGLRSISSVAVAARGNPGNEVVEVEMTEVQRDRSAGLMRVNHTGEVCAQALYQGHTLTARDAETRERMEQAAEEEIDHLAWCDQRLRQLASHPSYLNALWYSGSFIIGLLAGVAGDTWSLGFVAETEGQVVKHLESHLELLGDQDPRSSRIIAVMRDDEAKHETMALEEGASELPETFKFIMALMSKVMTTVAYRI